MNKVNGYCQIELPDRITINDLTSNYVTLTKAEAKPIIEKLGLGGIKLPEEERVQSAIYKEVKDALISKPVYIVTKRSIDDGIIIVPAIITDEIVSGDTITISAVVDKSPSPLHLYILLDMENLANVEVCPTIYDVEISINAYEITTTTIS